MRKRILAIGLCCVMVLQSALPAHAAEKREETEESSVAEVTAEAAAEEETTTESNTCGDNLTWSLDETGTTLTISGTGAMTDWSSAAGVPWYSFRSKLEKVVFTDEVTTIGAFAFANCTALKEIENIEQIQEYGNSAFLNCTALTEITIPAKVTNLGTKVFEKCTGLTKVIYQAQTDAELATKPFFNAGNENAPFEVVIGDNVKAIPNELFYQSNVGTITIGSSVESIGDQAFSRCNVLESIVIPNNVTTLGTNVFQSCSNLSSVTLSSNMTTIPQQTFAGCIGLKQFTIPNHIESIGMSAFQGCTNLTSVTLSDEMIELPEAAFSGCTSLGEISGGEKVTKIGKKALEKTAITECLNMDTVTSVGQSAYYQTPIEKIVIPEDMSYIGVNAYGNCLNLTKITYLCENEELVCGSSVFANSGNTTNDMTAIIGDGVKSIPDNLFYSAANLKSVDIGQSVTTIGQSAFSGCTSLTTITGGEAVKEIESQAFNECTSLTEIVLPEHTKKIGDNAFSNCTGLTTVEYNCTEAEVGLEVFRYAGSADNLITLIIGDEVTKLPAIGHYMTYLGEIRFGSSVKEIADEAFSNCSSLESVEIPDGVTVLGMGAFSNCDSLETARIGSGVTVIEDRTFANCDNLTTVTLPEGVEAIGVNAFTQCHALKSVSLPSTVKKIENNAFYWCKSLEKMEIPDSVTELGAGVFMDCPALTTVTLPSYLQTLEESVFSGCSSLIEARIPASVTSIGKYCFKGCTALLESVTPTEYGVKIYCNWVIGYEPVTTNTDIKLEIPEGTVGILPYVFYEQTNIVSLSLPSTLTFIGYRAFAGCENLATVTGGEKVTDVPVEAFEGTEWYDGENSIAILGNTLWHYDGSDETWAVPEQVEIIGANAFYGNADTKTVVLHSGIKEIQDGAFSSGIEQIIFEDNPDATFLESIEQYGIKAFAGSGLQKNIVDSWDNEEYSTTGASTDGTTIYSLAGRLMARKLIADGEVTNIKEAYDWLCKNCAYEATGAEYLTTAQGPFFYSTASCQGYALALKAFLDELGYPNFVLKGDVTGEVDGEKKTQIHAWNVVKIGNIWYHFDATDTRYGDYSTYEMQEKDMSQYGWERDDFEAGIGEAEGLFEEHKESEAELEYTLQLDGTYWVTDCSPVNVESVVVPATYEGAAVSGIGEEAFKNCSWLTSVTLPEGIKTIQANAFQNCIALNIINFPSTITTIEGAAFRSCFSLQSVDLSKTKLAELPSQVFSGCISLQEVKFNGNTTSIGDLFHRGGASNRMDGTSIITIYGPVSSAAESFAGEKEYTFKSVEGEDILLSNTVITLSKTEYVYDGNAKTPSVNVTYGKLSLIEGTDYSISYKDNVNAGTATVTVKGLGSYTGDVKKTFTIEKAQ